MHALQYMHAMSLSSSRSVKQLNEDAFMRDFLELTRQGMVLSSRRLPPVRQARFELYIAFLIARATRKQKMRLVQRSRDVQQWSDVNFYFNMFDRPYIHRAAFRAYALRYRPVVIPPPPPGPLPGPIGGGGGPPPAPGGPAGP